MFWDMKEFLRIEGKNNSSDFPTRLKWFGFRWCNNKEMYILSYDDAVSGIIVCNCEYFGKKCHSSLYMGWIDYHHKWYTMLVD